MKLNEKGVRWLEAELIVVLAVVLLLGVLFGYSLAFSNYSVDGKLPNIEEPAPMRSGVGGDIPTDIR